MKIDISLLQENPINIEIYGTDDQEQFNDLLEKINILIGKTNLNP